MFARIAFQWVKDNIKREEGQAMAEYGIILALIAATQFGSLGPIISWTAVAGAYFGYFLLSEALFGNTFGKWSMGLRIRTLSGQKCTVGQSVIRSLLRLVEVNPIVLGALPAGVAMLFSKRRQRFGDMLAGTVVVRRGS